jgi:dolichol-phosphate mannosyltransferase
MGQYTGGPAQFSGISTAPRPPGLDNDRSVSVHGWQSVKSMPGVEIRALLGEQDLDLSDDTQTPSDLQTQLPALSLVVPTRNEADNVAELVRRVERAMPDLPTEIIFVDDSTDGTPETIEALQGRYRPEIILVHRPPEQRGDGLGGAVVRGLQMARGPWVCVMDADLQHPPELLPRMLEATVLGSVDLVVASRYCGGGDAGTFGHLRATVSQASTHVARFMFPNRLRNVTDPMSGFFLIRRDALDLEALRPCGFKILLEIIGRTPGLRTTEVPFQFGMRHAGESKASLREGLRYLQLLLNLRFSEGALRLARFGLVGASGLLVNALVLAFTTEVLGIFYLLSAVIATQGSTLWNFGLSESWVFRRTHSPQGRPRRLAMFLIMNNAAFGLRAPMIVILTATLGFHYLASNLISLVTLLVLRYGVADHIIWASAQRPSGTELTDSAAVRMPISVE